MAAVHRALARPGQQHAAGRATPHVPHARAQLPNTRRRPGRHHQRHDLLCVGVWQGAASGAGRRTTAHRAAYVGPHIISSSTCTCTGYDLGSPVGTVITTMATEVPLLRLAEQTLMGYLSLLEQLCRAQMLLSSPHADVLLVAQLQAPQGEGSAEGADPAAMVRDVQHGILLPVRCRVNACVVLHV